MAADMSGFTGPGGAEAWMAASGGDRAAFNREMRAWQQSQAAAAAPAPTPTPTAAPDQLDQQAQWAHDNIDSTIDVNTWKAQGAWDPSCPQDYPYRSSRKGGDNACVEKPDNCPEGKTLHGDTCISNEAANQIFGGGYGGVPEGAYKQGGGKAAAPGAAPKPALTPQQELQQKLKEMYQNREGQFVGQTNTGQELAGGGIFWGQQAAPAAPPAPAPAANPTIAAISSGSGATPLSQGVTPAPQIQTTSSFAQSIGNESAGQQSIPMPANAKITSATAPTQPQSMGYAPSTGQLALSEAVKKQYSNPREQQQWWRAM